jgi:hypothetical protein
MTAKNSSTRPRLCYTAARYSDVGSPYEHFEIQVFYQNFLFTSETTVAITWQTDQNSSRWYGCNIQLNSSDSEMLEKSYKLAQRVIRGLEGRDPEHVLDRLETLKATEVVYDSRVSEFVPLAKVAGPEKKRWMDHWQRMGRSHCHIAVVAETEDEARKLILKEAAERNETRFISQFIDAGQPVFTNGDCQPDTTPARERVQIG